MVNVAKDPFETMNVLMGSFQASHLSRTGPPLALAGSPSTTPSPSPPGVSTLLLAITESYRDVTGVCYFRNQH
jgi:hypothetical protein